MMIRKGYKFRLNTSPEMEALRRPFAGCNRFLWNKALALQKKLLDNKQRLLSYTKLCKLLTIWKKEHPFLADAPSQALQQTLRSLSNALREAFDKKNPKQFPVFKRKFKCRESFRYPQGFEICNSMVYLPKIRMGRVPQESSHQRQAQKRDCVSGNRPLVHCNPDRDQDCRYCASFRKSSGR
jgi:putative transposase